MVGSHFTLWTRMPPLLNISAQYRRRRRRRGVREGGQGVGGGGELTISKYQA